MFRDSDIYKSKENGQLYKKSKFPTELYKDSKEYKILMVPVDDFVLSTEPIIIDVNLVKYTDEEVEAFKDEHHIIGFISNRSICTEKAIEEKFDKFHFPKCDNHRIYSKWLVVWLNGVNGNIGFLKEERRMTYDINNARLFDSKEEADQYVEEHQNQLLCPTVVDYRIAEDIARFCAIDKIYYGGSRVGEYYF